MKKQFIIAMVAFAMPLLADRIGNVEYNLPMDAQNWQAGTIQGKDKKNQVKYYTPNGEAPDDANQFFEAIHVGHPVNLHDTEALKKLIRRNLPGMRINLWRLEGDEDSVLYEWSALGSGQEVAHGWGRAFKTHKSTIVLTYETQHEFDLSTPRQEWVPVLKNAHVSGSLETLDD